MQIPPFVAEILETLRRAGFESYAVGGCVRDSLLGKTPHDWDVATSAPAAQTAAVFAGRRVLFTGAAHGTVTILTGQGPVEVTTFRADGAYGDHRRPDRVDFIQDVHRDLMRRDFTVNAMAYCPQTGLVDDFGGRQDLQNRVLRAVGDPEARFEEDALRMLRAVRFAAQLDFQIEPETERALLARRADLRYVSGERILNELEKLTAAPGALGVLQRYEPLVESALGVPRVGPFLQRMPEAPAALCALLLTRGREWERAAARIRLPGREKALLADAFFAQTQLDAGVPEAQVLLALGPRRAGQALSVLAAWPGKYGAACARTASLVESGRCFQVCDLAVNGEDLKGLGLRGPQVGAALRALLTMTALQGVPNERTALLSACKDILEGEDAHDL